MDNPKINFLNTRVDNNNKGKKKNLSKLFFYCSIFIFIFILLFTFQVVLSGESILENFQKINIFSGTLGKDDTEPLKGEADDRINILLLGMGGEGHPGPYLTDTIIVVSIKPSNGDVAMISIPRDLSVPIPGYGWRKVNSANHYGEMKNPDAGGEFATEVISSVFDLPIHYYVRVDFSGFEKLIDQLGGIKVNVANGFTDYQFPTDDYGYQTVSFKTGWQKMDGKTALNFARSRHGTNGENSDFARSKRQQQVLTAAKEEILSFSTLLSYRKLASIYELYKDRVTTNLQITEMYKLAKLAKKINTLNIKSVVLDNGNDGPLYSTIASDGAYILLPKDMSFYQLQQMVKYAFEPAKEVKIKEQVKVEIQNGTKVNGLAYRISLDLKNNGFKILKIGNATEQSEKMTTIYDFTSGNLKDELQNIKKALNTNNIAQPSEALRNLTDPEIDFLIVLGYDQQSISVNQ